MVLGGVVVSPRRPSGSRPAVAPLPPGGPAALAPFAAAFPAPPHPTPPSLPPYRWMERFMVVVVLLLLFEANSAQGWGV